MRAFEGKRRGSRRTYFVEAEMHEVLDILDIKPSAANEGYKESLDKEWAAGSSFHFGESQEIDSIDGVKQRFNRGWAEGAEKAMKLARDLKGSVAAPQSIRRKPEWGDEGDDVSWERTLAGDYETNWRRRSKRITRGLPIINIAAPFGGSAGRSESQLFWSGAAAVCLSNLLEEAGYRTNIDGISVNVRNGLAATVIHIKKSDEYLRPDALASVLCYSGTYRTVVFTSYCSVPWDLGAGLGTNGLPTSLIPACVDEGVMYPPNVTLPDCFDESSAKIAVQNALRHLEDANLAAIGEV